MIDFARITVIAGKGGSGSGSFLHIKGKRLGKADGGDGGKGGDVYLEATGDLNTLEPFRYVKEYRGKNGVSGLSRKRNGAEGDDLVIKVPAGTTVKLNRSDESNRSYESYIYDLVEVNQKALIARGGEGGRGNAHLRDEFRRRPKIGEKGEEGERIDLTLELKLIADVGLIGLPNAGKSTLLAALTQATPKIADYPFTTLEPNLGVLQIGGFAGRWDSGYVKGKPTIPLSNYPKNLVLADIPGLIEGASEGKGLGDLFLRHIERTRTLVHLIDISRDSDKQSLRSSPAERGPGLKWHDYQTIRGELKSHSKDLVKKKEIIALTKIDLASKDEVDEILKLFKAKKKKVVAISAVTKEGLADLLDAVFAAIPG